MNFYRTLSDVVLAIHFGFVAFIVVGFVTIWIGYFRRWSFVRAPIFRIMHLAAMAIVLLESCAGLVCPLTRWEDELRLRAGQKAALDQSCMQRWVGALLFYEASERVFTIIYSGFFLLIVLTFWVVPLRRGLNRGGDGSEIGLSGECYGNQTHGCPHRKT